MGTHDDDHGNECGRRVGRWVFGGFALIALYFLLMEHRAHVFAGHDDTCQVMRALLKEKTAVLGATPARAKRGSAQAARQEVSPVKYLTFPRWEGLKYAHPTFNRYIYVHDT